ncbi:Hemerythrin-like metal-binding protein [Candidatus Sulfopaludibacter sp. SbA3]|nr:Hemerythrin-like metal-binding protein [Candidatus Sulfopaludibacter sp. SbA3]
MSLFKWSEAHSVHLPEVDAEHRNLFRLSAEFKSALERGAPQSAVEEKLQALFAEMEDHFTHEERLMRSARYELFAWHKGQHDTVRKRGKEYASRIRAGELEAGKELLEFLARWLRDHLAVADNMMGASIRNYHRLHAA